MKDQPNKKPRILVLMCEGGGGHKSASVSLQEILSPNYEIDVINVISTVLPPIDPLRICTFGKRYAEDLYNFCMQKDLYRFLNYFVRIGNRYMLFQKKKIAKLFEKYLISQPQLPDLIISTVPFINHGLVLATHKLNIPYLLLPTDLDTATFLRGFDRMDREVLKRFKMAMAYERPEMILQVFKHSVLEPTDLAFPGFPVHPACQKTYTPEEIERLKSHFGLASGKKIVTLVMGAAGSGTIFHHTQIIAQLSSKTCGPIEVNICVGRNRKIQSKIINWLHREGGWLVQKNEERTSILMPKGTLLHIRNFTEELTLIMACSDLIISKTGSCSVNEAIYLRKKILLDNTLLSTARYLWWEKFNVPFVKRHGLGAAFTQSEELHSLIPFMLNHICMPAQALKLPDFHTNIQNLVSSLIK